MSVAVDHCFLCFGDPEFPHILSFPYFFYTCAGCYLLYRGGGGRKFTFNIQVAVPFLAFCLSFHDNVSSRLLLNPHL